VSHDCGTAQTVENPGTTILGSTEWGMDFMSLLKYLFMRFV